MKAIILAAGEGKRMRPLTYTRPKVMLTIANRPILEHLLLEIKAAGIDEFIFVIGYHGETIQEYFGHGERWGVRIDYAIQRNQLGTAHALKTLEGKANGQFLLLNGDILIREKYLKRLLSRKGIVLSVMEVVNPNGLGVVETANDRVIRVEEKVKNPRSRLANVGVYLFTADVFEAVSQTPKSSRGEYEITDSIQWLIDQGHEVFFERVDWWLDLSYPWDLLKANELLLREMEPKNLGTVEENVTLRGPIFIGKGSVIRANSYIVGPVSIGENCEIGPNCYIRPGTSIGDNCHIGSAVEIKNSIIMRGTKIPHHNYVGDSVIGEGCNLGAGTKVANLRLDEANVVADGIETGRRKLGVIIGDGVRTGINACLNPGTLIGSHTYIGPGAVVSGTVLPNSRIF